MNVETLQTTSQIIVVLGIVITAAGGFGSYFFGKRAESERTAELRHSLSNLEQNLAPFAELARQARPGADQDAALAGLRTDIEELRRIASKHEFTPLDDGLKATLIRSIRGLAPEFAEAGMNVTITHETWTNPPTRAYAAQLVSLLKEAGLRASGPEQITYYLINPSSPLEWGYNVADIPRAEKLYAALVPFMGPTTAWTKANHQEAGSMRLHFGGSAVFSPDGTVELK